ncbi:GDSL esterase/lipase At5g08460-like [Cicer arietinum]|uniref:GDSL esterase/lipase At5g08460-like n=1 Tax=Cicer arietinum TaxID=3827 RepID=UPI003CC69A3B
MKMVCLLVVSLPLWSMLLMSISSGDTPREPLFSAMFVFGDSLVDNGNNNKLHSLAKANYVPYGIDFPGDHPSPTGRFCYGKTFGDFLGNLSGIREVTGRNLLISMLMFVFTGTVFIYCVRFLENVMWPQGEHISFTQQVSNFEKTLSQTKSLMEDENLSQYLANSFTTVIHGSNDYINNYLMPEFYGTSFMYSPNNYADILIEHYKENILVNLLTYLTHAHPSAHTLLCIYIYIYIYIYEEGSNYVICVSYDMMIVCLLVIDKACCGIGRNNGQINCLPMFNPCPNRDQYVFWDPVHPSQAVNKTMASKAFTGTPSDSYPINVYQMAQKQLPSGQNNASATSEQNKKVPLKNTKEQNTSREEHCLMRMLMAVVAFKTSCVCLFSMGNKHNTRRRGAKSGQSMSFTIRSKQCKRVRASQTTLLLRDEARRSHAVPLRAHMYGSYNTFSFALTLFTLKNAFMSGYFLKFGYGCSQWMILRVMEEVYGGDFAMTE